MMKICKIVGMLILIAQMKRPDALNTTQKTPAICNLPFLNKSRKTAKNVRHGVENVYHRVGKVYIGSGRSTMVSIKGQKVLSVVRSKWCFSCLERDYSKYFFTSNFLFGANFQNSFQKYRFPFFS